MVVGRARENSDSLRAELRLATRLSHDRLDQTLAPLAIGGRQQYAAFLSTQFRVRAGIEDWATSNLGADLLPPSVAPLIARDLEELGQTIPASTPFELPPNADPIGLVWVIGGSALGNKSLLARRKAIGAHEANHFLGDTQTIAYFSHYLPRLEMPSDPGEVERATLAAQAVFDAFLGEAQRLQTAVAA